MSAYLDTNVIVYAIENHPKYGASCKRILEDVQRLRLDAGCSVLVLVELINVLKRLNSVLERDGKNALSLKDNLEAVMSLPIVWFDMDLLVIERASTYSFNVNGVNHVHVATMELNSISDIISADQDFDKISPVRRIDPLGYGKAVGAGR